MVFEVLLVIVLFVTLISVLPTWGHSERWGYFPGSSVGLVLIIVVVLMLTRAF